MTASPVLRWAVLAVLLLVAVGCVVGATTIVATRAAGDGLGERLQSLRDDEPPTRPEADEREQLLSLARDFVTRFNTYNPDMVDDQGKMPDYAAVADLMTAKFADVFTKNVGYAEETVRQLGAAREATVWGVGVATQDVDSAQVLVAGTVELSYPARDREGGDGEDEPRLSSGPQRFRYEVSLVKVEGRWLVDDLDDVDDGLPPFSQPSIPEDAPEGGATDPTAPTTPPTEGTP